MPNILTGGPACQPDDGYSRCADASDLVASSFIDTIAQQSTVSGSAEHAISALDADTGYVVGGGIVDNLRVAPKAGDLGAAAYFGAVVAHADCAVSRPDTS